MRLTQSFRIEPEVWKEFKKFCIDQDKNYSKMLEELINERLKKEVRKKK